MFDGKSFRVCLNSRPKEGHVKPPGNKDQSHIVRNESGLLSGHYGTSPKCHSSCLRTRF